ncbi:MAG: hypothetical protein IGR93_15170 [Hydrococcus sp. C42_A2020_068]|uniref:hypothetical protein n=1 Tax=Pleurocapsa sp. PCC 7327 TaxID=118163 RepID=UPI00029FA573|nr:hypothetical protein [Pleurocapsa sp. PCC 7327]AFY78993.1 hypothetical protein Ple7327_3831 [Pleurocapsa sp. PCC 7327]MBF2021400.1 hypothetical protein [Hydrococcus sp. C42_A2020_068]
MPKQVSQIGFIGATVVGLTCLMTPANSATIQTSTQKALVVGENNRVTQLSQQTSLDLFFFDLHLDRKSFLDESPIKNFINSEILEFINDFGENILEIDQSISQIARLSGNNNRVTQISAQNIFDVFFLDPELRVTMGENTTYTLPVFDISQILSDRVAAQLPDIEQSVIQEANVFGSDNQVRQVNAQTVIDFFLIDIKFSAQLVDIVVRRTDDNLDNLVNFELYNFLDDLETLLPFQELPDSFFQDNNPIVLENRNYSINEVQSITVPESSSVFALLSLTAIGLGSAILRKYK